MAEPLPAPLNALGSRVQETAQRFGLKAPTPPQVEGIPKVLEGRNVLILAPTGTGKTEAALLPVLDRLLHGEREGIGLVYITPLRALNRDMQLRLERWCTALGLTVAVRHGDTPQKDRRKQAAKPPDVLITTPETLQAILPAKVMRRHLRHVRHVIVDEIHQLAHDRRGVQLMVALERLREATEHDFQRVGLSATVGGPKEIARFLGGGSPVDVVEVSAAKRMSFAVEWPRPNEEDFETARELYISPEAAASISLMADRMEARRSALVFVNSRNVAELLGHRFSMLSRDVAVHHGWLPREERERAEGEFKAGKLKALVCIPHDEPVVTSGGVKAAKDVAVGDEVLSYDSESYSTVFKPVTETFVRVADRLVHVKHEFGLLRVTPNHPILCLGPDGFRWRAAGELKVGDALVTVGKVEGKKAATHSLISYPNLFVKNSEVAALGYEPPKAYPNAKVTRLLALKSIMSENDLLKLTRFSTTQSTYAFPPWVDSRLGYLLGFQKSDGDRYLRFFNTDVRKLRQVESFLSRLYDGSMYRVVLPAQRRSSFPSDKPSMVLQAQSKPLVDLMSNLWRKLPLEEKVAAAFLAAYLDGDGCLAIRDGRLEQIQFETFNPINREYLLFTLLAMGFKPKLWKANGVSGDGFSISIAYKDDKARLFPLVRGLSIKAKDTRLSDYGNKPKTYYGLGPYLKTARRNLGVSSYQLWKRMRYSTRYEDPVRGMTRETLARLNEHLNSPLLKQLLLGAFGVSQVREVKVTDGETSVVNFEVEGTQTYSLTGIVTHNCTSTLELGIDVGSVDLVLQYMSPRQVTSLIQRVGRAGHSLDRTSEGVIVSVHSDDTVESVAAIGAAKAGELEPPKIHRGARDVLGHQIVGAVLDEGGRREVESIWSLIRRAEPYRDFPRDAFDRVVDFLAHIKLLRKDGTALAATNRTREYYFTNLSTIRDERRYRAVDLATQQPVGILGEEFMMLRARAGYNFIVKGRTWKIQKIAEDGTIYVDAISDPTAALPGWDGEMLPVPYGLALRAGAIRGELDAALDGADAEAAAERLAGTWPLNRTAVKRLVQETAGHRATGAPVPTDRRILLEGFGRFLILHAHFGEVVNETFGDLLEELLARKNLVRFWWSDAYHILFELVVDSGDLDLRALADELLGIDDAELERSLKILTEEHLPIGYYMKFIAERFGALQRGLIVAADELNSIQLRFAHTPIEEEGLREAMLLHADYDSVRGIFRKVRSGEIEVATHRSIDSPTPLGYHILQRIVEAPELFTPEAEKDASLERMRMHVEAQLVNLLCFGCGTFHEGLRVGTLPDAPVCSSCGSHLLGVLNWSAWSIRDALARKQRKEELGDEERKALARVRQTADLVAVYGRRAVVAQRVYGVGPQTAAKILARMHDDDRAFLEDLFEAKLQYITTRPYWDERNRGGPAARTLYT